MLNTDWEVSNVITFRKSSITTKTQLETDCSREVMVENALS